MRKEGDGFKIKKRGRGGRKGADRGERYFEALHLAETPSTSKEPPMGSVDNITGEGVSMGFLENFITECHQNGQNQNPQETYVPRSPTTTPPPLTDSERVLQNVKLEWEKTRDFLTKLVELTPESSMPPVHVRRCYCCEMHYNFPKENEMLDYLFHAFKDLDARNYNPPFSIPHLRCFCCVKTYVQNNQ